MPGCEVSDVCWRNQGIQGAIAGKWNQFVDSFQREEFRYEAIGFPAQKLHDESRAQGGLAGSSHGRDQELGTLWVRNDFFVITLTVFKKKVDFEMQALDVVHNASKRFIP